MTVSLKRVSQCNGRKVLVTDPKNSSAPKRLAKAGFTDGLDVYVRFEDGTVEAVLPQHVEWVRMLTNDDLIRAIKRGEDYFEGDEVDDLRYAVDLYSDDDSDSSMPNLSVLYNPPTQASKYVNRPVYILSHLAHRVWPGDPEKFDPSTAWEIEEIKGWYEP